MLQTHLPMLQGSFQIDCHLPDYSPSWRGLSLVGFVNQGELLQGFSGDL